MVLACNPDCFSLLRLVLLLRPLPNSIAWADNYTSTQHQAIQSGKPIILFLTGKWCVSCKVIKRNIWTDQQVTASVNAAFIPVMIDVDNP